MIHAFVFQLVVAINKVIVTVLLHPITFVVSYCLLMFFLLSLMNEDLSVLMRGDFLILNERISCAQIQDCYAFFEGALKVVRLLLSELVS